MQKQVISLSSALQQLFIIFYLCIWTDGRPAPPLKGQLRRKQEREVLAVSITTRLSCSFCVCFKATSFLSFLCRSSSQRRIVMLSSEVDRGIEAWSEKQENARRLEEHKKSLLLKPKGKLLMKKKPL